MEKQAAFIQNSFNSLLPSLKYSLQNNNNSRVKPNSFFQLSNPSDSLASFQQQLNKLCYKRKYTKNKQNQTNNLILPSIQKDKLNNDIQFLKTRLDEIAKQKEIQQKIFNRVEKYLLPTFQMNSMAYNHYNNNSLSQLKNSIQTKKFSKNKQFKRPLPKRNYLSLFRSAVYVVMFILWFPKYSLNFTKNRLAVYLKHFLNKQTIIQKIEIQNYFFDTFQIVKIISQIGIQLSVKFNSKEIKQLLNFIKKYNQKNKMDNQQQIQQFKKYKNDNIKFNMKIICKILQKAYENLKQQMKGEQMNSLYYIISSCCLNGGFLVDNIYLQQQIETINFHTLKGYMINDQQKEKLLIINFFFVRVIVFNVFINFQNNDGFSQRVKKIYNLKQQQITGIKSVISISSLYLLLVCQYIFMQRLYNIQGNYQQLKPKLKPKISKLQFILPSNQEKDKNSIRFSKISQLLQIFQQNKLINSLSDQKYNNYLKKSVSYIHKIANMIHKQAKEWKKGHYKQLHMLSAQAKFIKVPKNIYQFRQQQTQSQENQFKNYQTKRNVRDKKSKTNVKNNQLKNDSYDDNSMDKQKTQNKKNKKSKK